jgi:hypothetical protein
MSMLYVPVNAAFVQAYAAGTWNAALTWRCSIALEMQHGLKHAA